MCSTLELFRKEYNKKIDSLEKSIRDITLKLDNIDNRLSKLEKPLPMTSVDCYAKVDRGREITQSEVEALENTWEETEYVIAIFRGEKTLLECIKMELEKRKLDLNPEEIEKLIRDSDRITIDDAIKKLSFNRIEKDIKELDNFFRDLPPLITHDIIQMDMYPILRFQDNK